MSKLYAFEVVFDKAAKQNVIRVRTLLPEGAKKYDKEQHFQWFASSDYLDAVLGNTPYATFTTDDPLELENVLNNGFSGPDGVLWMPCFAYWKDDGGNAILCPESAGIKGPEDLGIITHMNSLASSMKVGKYVHRLFADLPKKLYGGSDPVWGKEVDWKEDESHALVQIEPHDDLTEDDCLISVKYVDLDTLTDEEKGLVDGAIAISSKAVRALGLSNKPRLGMAWLGTVLTERGLGKGHFLYVPHLEHDIIIYGPKTVVRGKKFFFGSMGALSDHMVPHTDRQAFINFGFHRPGMAIEVAKMFMREVVEKSNNEAEFRKLFLKHTSDSDELNQEGWVLRRALLYGISFNRFPGLFRRCVRYLLTRVMDIESRARVPMESDTYSVAKYAHVLPDLDAISSDGDVKLDKSSIPTGCIVFPDLKPGTEVACYRQPSEHSNAHVILKVVEGNPAYARFEGKNICLLGRGASDALKVLGGGDMDDLLVIVHDPVWVAAFKSLRPYPVTEKVADMVDASNEDQSLYDTDSSDLAAYSKELDDAIKNQGMTTYTSKHVHWQIEMAKTARAGIGMVVNYGMFDMLLSDPDHKNSMLNDINVTTDVGAEAWDWLNDREPYQAAFYMTNLERVIDASVKDVTLIQPLGDVAGTIRKFHKECKVYPTSMALRIPESRLKAARKNPDKDGYILARSMTCKALEFISKLRVMVQEKLIQREWDLVTPADDTLLPRKEWEKELRIRLIGEWVPNVSWQDGDPISERYFRVDEDGVSILTDLWRGGFREAAQKGIPIDIAYRVICDRIAKELENEDADYMERLSVHLYYELYKRYGDSPRVDEETGELRGYPDGLLWSPVFANHFINALRKARVTGYYYPVTLRSEYKRRLSGASEMVQLIGHSVYIRDSKDEYNILVGVVDIENRIANLATGKIFRMDDGIIEFRQAKEMCLPINPDLLIRRPITRVYPLKVEEGIVEAAQKAAKPKGILGKALKAALDLLK